MMVPIEAFIILIQPKRRSLCLYATLAPLCGQLNLLSKPCFDWNCRLSSKFLSSKFLDVPVFTGVESWFSPRLRGRLSAPMRPVCAKLHSLVGESLRERNRVRHEANTLAKTLMRERFPTPITSSSQAQGA